MKAPALPSWVDDVLRRFGPQPAMGRATADAEAVARYERMTMRFRQRWHAELVPDVWALFGQAGDGILHVEQAMHLMGLMVDLARGGSMSEMSNKRQALADVERLEDELRELAGQMRRKLSARSSLMHEHLIDGGIEEQDAAALDSALAAVALQSWSAPRLQNIYLSDAINSRKTERDALALMLYQLEHLAPLLQPVVLTDRARAAIFNVAHDTDEAGGYTDKAIKKARADLRHR